MVTDNLFFRKDDGSVLAIHIESSMGPGLLQVLRGLSQQREPLSQLSALPFESSASDSLTDDLTDDTRKLSLAEKASAAPSSSAPSSKVPTSTKASMAPLHSGIPSSSTSSSSSSKRTFDKDAWMGGIFSAAIGKPYDRDWISANNVDAEILKGVPSKHKLDLLVRHGAVVVGDKLCVMYHVSGKPVVIEGEVSVQVLSIAITITYTISFNRCCQIPRAAIYASESRLPEQDLTASSGLFKGPKTWSSG